MQGPNRLLDNAFRSELERLALAAERPTSGRRRAGKRKASGRASRSTKREHAAEDLSEDVAMSRFFSDLMRRSVRRALLVVLDASETMEQPSATTNFRKFDQACKLAAALSIVLRPGYDRVQIVAVGHARGNRSPIVRGGLERNDVPLQFIKRLRPGGNARFVHVLQRYVKRLAMATDCLVISDMLASEWEPAMAILTGDRRIRTSLVHISDPADSDMSEQRVVLASDAESANRPLDIDVSRRFRAAINVDAEPTFDPSGVAPRDYLHLLTDEPFERALISALEQR